MYFSTYQPYSDELLFSENNISNIQIYEDTNATCIICLENVNIIILNKLDANQFLYKECCCNPIIHKKCFMLWYNKENRCPICNTYLQMKKSIFYKINFVTIKCLIVVLNIYLIITILLI